MKVEFEAGDKLILGGKEWMQQYLNSKGQASATLMKLAGTCVEIISVGNVKGERVYTISSPEMIAVTADAFQIFGAVQMFERLAQGHVNGHCVFGFSQLGIRERTQDGMVLREPNGNQMTIIGLCPSPAMAEVVKESLGMIAEAL